jgi:hypothetical protein
MTAILVKYKVLVLLQEASEVSQEPTASVLRADVTIQKIISYNIRRCVDTMNHRSDKRIQKHYVSG